MRRPRLKKPVLLDVTGPAPLPHAIEERERSVIDPETSALVKELCEQRRPTELPGRARAR